jgi:hypothetical protein
VRSKIASRQSMGLTAINYTLQATSILLILSTVKFTINFNLQTTNHVLPKTVLNMISISNNLKIKEAFTETLDFIRTIGLYWISIVIMRKLPKKSVF